MDLTKFKELQLEELRLLTELLSHYKGFIATSKTDVEKQFYKYSSKVVTYKIDILLDGDIKLLELFKNKIIRSERKNLESKLDLLEKQLEEDDFDE